MPIEPHTEKQVRRAPSAAEAPREGAPTAQPRVVVAIASHQRTTPLSIVLRHLPADWHAVVVVSEQEDAKALPTANCQLHTALFPNEPLGAKWQHAVDRARELDPDLLVITGSDDVLKVQPDKLFDAMQGIDLLGFNSFTAYDGRHHYRCSYRPHVKLPIGSGRVYRRELLEKMRWRLFDVEKQKHLDERGYWNAMRAGGKVRIVDQLPGMEVIALKGSWPCKNSLDKYRRGRNLEVTPITDVRDSRSYQF